jgi:hypothetical protein
MLSLDLYVPESLANFITDIRPLDFSFNQELMFWKEAQMSGAVDRIAGAAGERAGFRPARAPRFDDAEGSEARVFMCFPHLLELSLDRNSSFIHDEGT